MPSTLSCLWIPQARAFLNRRNCMPSVLGHWRSLGQLPGEPSDTRSICELLRGCIHPQGIKEQGRYLAGEPSVARSICNTLKECIDPQEETRFLQILHPSQQILQPDSSAFSRFIQECCRLKALPEGKQIHAHVVYKGLAHDPFLLNNLIAMYVKCRSVDDARNVFDTMNRRNVVSWTSMIAAYAHHGHGDEGLQLFRRMQMEGLLPNKVTLVSVLNVCSDPQALSEGKIMHVHIFERGFASDLIVGNALVSMYGKCGSMEDARSTFDKLHQWNAVSWSTMVATSAQNGHGREAIRLFETIQLELSKPSNVANTGMNNVSLVKSAFPGGRMLDRPHQEDVVSWNALIAECAQQGHDSDSLGLFQQMQLEGIMPNAITFVTILVTCSSASALLEGKKIHTCIAENGLQSDIAVGSSLVSMYGKCGSLKDLWMIFNKLPKEDVVPWNAMIGAYACRGHCKAALQVFIDMQLAGLKPDKVTLVLLLSACSSLANFADGKMIHGHIVETGFELDVFVASALLNMYSKCESVLDRDIISDKLEQQHLILWTSMLVVYDQLWQGRGALELFWQMKKVGLKPNVITFVSVLSACSNLAAMEQGNKIHACIVESGFEVDVAVGSALVNMYGKGSSLEDAKKVFDSMHLRNVLSWTSLIAAYSQHEHCKGALQLFQQMLLEGMKPTEITFISVLHVCASSKSLTEGRQMQAYVVESGFELDVAVGNALVSMYGKCGSVEDAERVFDRMYQQTDISWTAMITTFAQLGQCKRAIQLFQEMHRKGVKPNEVTFVSVLSACATVAALRRGHMFHASIIENGFELDNVVCSALLDMYGRCGKVVDARRLFDKIFKQCPFIWNGMLTAYAQNGHGKEALQLFQQMQQDGIQPNLASFISVLFACSHAGLVAEGCRHFLSMHAVYGLSPISSHYVCMIDLFGRAGQLEEAENFINDMPFKPGVVEWMALLSACRIYGDVQRGKRAAEQVLSLNSRHAPAYIILSNIYADAGRGIFATNARHTTVNQGMKGPLGCSFIEIGSRVLDRDSKDHAYYPWFAI